MTFIFNLLLFIIVGCGSEKAHVIGIHTSHFIYTSENDNEEKKLFELLNVCKSNPQGIFDTIKIMNWLTNYN